MLRSHVTFQRSWVYSAAVAAIASLALSTTAMAQYPTSGQDGHARDANNRVGSGGTNDARPTNGIVTPNDIVNRNVTGGKEFRGPVLEKDPRAFTGPAAGTINDVFIRQSNGVPDSSGAADNQWGQARPYYGDSRYTPPPAGSLPEGFNGGYIGTTLTSPSSLSNGLAVNPGVTGLNSRTQNRDTYMLDSSLTTGGYGGVTPGNYGSINSNLMPNAALDSSLGAGLATPASSLFPGRTGLADDATVLRMQMELREAAQSNPAALNSTLNNQTTAAQTPSLNQPLNAPLNQPFGAPQDTAVTNSLTSSRIQNSALSSTGNLADVRRADLVPAAEQSSLLKTLQARLADSSDVGKALAAAQQSQQARASAQQPMHVTTPKTTGGAAVLPVQVSSLATGVRAKGLHDLLANAEDVLRQGKYDNAIQLYNVAQRVAPNNPLALVGRAHAEMGAGYYARAEQDIRTAIRGNPELLKAQFDLAGTLPPARVDFIRKDLHDLADNDAHASRPWFLLAYLDYNTSQPASASHDIDEAEKRSGGRGDWALRLMKQLWTLTAAQTPKTSTDVPVAPEAPPTATPAPSNLNK